MVENNTVGAKCHRNNCCILFSPLYMRGLGKEHVNSYFSGEHSLSFAIMHRQWENLFLNSLYLCTQHVLPYSVCPVRKYTLYGTRWQRKRKIDKNGLSTFLP
jgi:hypothetical protein